MIINSNCWNTARVMPSPNDHTTSWTKSYTTLTKHWNAPAFSRRPDFVNATNTDTWDFEAPERRHIMHIDFLLIIFPTEETQDH